MSHNLFGWAVWIPLIRLMLWAVYQPRDLALLWEHECPLLESLFSRPRLARAHIHNPLGSVILEWQLCLGLPLSAVGPEGRALRPRRLAANFGSSLTGHTPLWAETPSWQMRCSHPSLGGGVRIQGVDLLSSGLLEGPQLWITPFPLFQILWESERLHNPLNDTIIFKLQSIESHWWEGERAMQILFINYICADIGLRSTMCFHHISSLLTAPSKSVFPAPTRLWNFGW